MKNLQILIGNLGNETEAINFSNGNKITKFSLATSRTWKDKDSGERKKDTQWHNIVAQNKFSDNADKYLKKGDKVYLEGETRHRSYEVNGEKKYITEVYVTGMTFLSSNSEKTNQSTPLDHMPDKRKSASNDVQDDLPF